MAKTQTLTVSPNMYSVYIIAWYSLFLFAPAAVEHIPQQIHYFLLLE